LECRKVSAGSGYKLTLHTCGERTHYSRQTGVGAGYCRILKGQCVIKTSAAQEDKNDTQQSILNKNRPNLLADYYDVKLSYRMIIQKGQV
jgi:hypothetical protein